ncbi:hypothetical protein GQ44DRAFT_699314 [Phaeosphaeriaceae sp. PMI808]|nr:hypothetical protein GQ44DRAFT_699314 [Phaeosphaeriaceae sp. PMI808]
MQLHLITASGESKYFSKGSSRPRNSELSPWTLLVAPVVREPQKMSMLCWLWPVLRLLHCAWSWKGPFHGKGDTPVPPSSQI